MEKFGIFELLDALSALTSAQSDAPAPPEATEPAQSAPPPGERPEPRTAEEDALSAFLARHDAISRRIKK